MSEDEELRIKATKRVEQKIVFYWNISAYIPVNILHAYIGAGRNRCRCNLFKPEIAPTARMEAWCES